MFLLELIQHMDKLVIDNDAVDLCKLKDVGNVVRLQPVVRGRNHCTSRRDAVDGLKKRRRVGRENANALEAVLFQIIGQASGAIGEFLVGAVQDGAVGGDVIDCLGIRLNGCSALEEECWRQMVNVRRRSLVRNEMAEN